MRAVLFLDMDGVLNEEAPESFDRLAMSSRVLPHLVAELNLVLARAPWARIVVSSSWRYMIHGGAMTVQGFEYMLRTHGCAVVDKVIDVTPKDESIPLRGDQILAWLDAHPVEHWAAVDDTDCSSMQKLGDRFVKTNPTEGLTFDDGVRLSALLGARVTVPGSKP